METIKQKKKRSVWPAIVAILIVLILLAGAGALFNLYWNGWHVDVYLRGDTEETVECGSAWEDRGAWAVYGGRRLFPDRARPEVTAEGTVDTAVPGTYPRRRRRRQRSRRPAKRRAS